MPLQSNLNDVISFRVKDVSVPQTYFNITAAYRTFALTGNVTGAKFILIPPGNYTITQLSNFISTLWLAVVGTNITLDFTSPRFLMQVFVTGGLDATVSITATELAIPSMKYIFGVTGAIGFTSTFTAQSVFNLGGPSKILVQSVALNTGRNMSGINVLGTNGGGQVQKNNVIYAVWKQGNAGDIMNNFIPSDWYSFQTPQKINRLDFYLTDENNQPLDLNGYPWTITIEIRQKKNV